MKVTSNTPHYLLRLLLHLLSRCRPGRLHDWLQHLCRRLISLSLRLFYGGRGGAPRGDDIGPVPRRGRPLSPNYIKPEIEPQQPPQDSTYSLIEDGEVVPLDGVAYSSHQVYSLKSSALYNPARSSEILSANISHNERLIESRRGSPTPSSRNSTHTAPRLPGDDTSSIQTGRHALSLAPENPLQRSISIDSQASSAGVPPIPNSFQHLSSFQEDYTWPSSRVASSIPELMSSHRYSDRPIIEKAFQTVTVKKLNTSFDSPHPPTGWCHHAHPEGARYFSRHFSPQGWNVLTDADLPDPQILETVNADVQLLLHEFESRHCEIQSWHLVITSTYIKSGIQSFYYFVDHDARKLFYLEDIAGGDLDPLWTQAQGCNSLRHLGYAFESQYWLFVSLYPTCRPLSRELTQELRDITLYCIGDSVFSPSALAPYSRETLDNILDWSKAMDYSFESRRGPPGNLNVPAPGALSLLSRLMYTYYHDWYLHFHGEGHARLERHKSVYGQSTNRRTWLISILSPFLFYSPDVQLKHLQKLWVDDIMHKIIWEESVKKLNEEWQEYVLFGTVMLNANMGFLAIGTVDGSGNHARSPPQISSYLSIVASIGSILLALLLLRQSRTKIKETADDVQTFMEARKHPRLGLEMLAILYSLPYALLMWSVVAFLVAFAIYCFQHTTATTRVIVGSFSFVSAILIIWCIFQAWEKKEPDNGKALNDSIRRPTSQFGDRGRAESPIPFVSSPKESRQSSDPPFELPTLYLRKPTGDYLKGNHTSQVSQV